MKVLAVIPARGGSKSIPKKNIAMVAGKPLIAYTIEEALKVNDITDLVVSTDDDQIATLAESLGAQIPFMRPAELASDHAQSAPVLRHCLLHMEERRNLKYDAILMLQPTSPLRRSIHIENALTLLRENPCDSVVTVVSVAGYHPFRMKRMIGNRLINFIEQGFEDMRPRQVLPPVFIRNGAVYLTRRAILLNEERLVGDRCLGLEMGSNESINIDSPIDLKLAELLLQEETKK